MNAILALDQGTTSSRALIVAGDGRILGAAQRELRHHEPKPGWVEQDPLEIWATQKATALDAIAGSGVGGGSLAAVAIANQRETTIVWDRATSQPIGPAIVWQDRRTAPLCDELRRQGHDALIRRRTGLIVDPYFSATKLRWLLDHVPGAQERAADGELAFGTVDTWLIWHLSGGRLHLTDSTNASRTMLYDLQRGDWDDELLALLGIPAALLPTVVDSCGVVGYTDAALFGARLPIAGIVGDQQAALAGQACFRPGTAKVTYGTGCFLLLHTGEQPILGAAGLPATVALQRDGRRTYALEGSVFVGGAAIQWLRDGLGVLDQAADIEQLAAGASSSDGVVFVPALTGLGAPYWDPHARGMIAGISRRTTAAHLARATIEGIAFQVADLLAPACAAGRRPAELRADGGASASDRLLQTQADLIGAPVVRSAQIEATGLGAAYLAGLAVGVWRDEGEVAALWRADRRFVPRPGIDRDGRMAEWRRAIDAARRFARPDDE